MNIPIGLIVVSRPANNFEEGAKVIYQKEIIIIEENRKQFYNTIKGKKIAIPGLTQLFFEITTVDPGVLVTYGRNRAATVKVIFVDEQRKWATIEYFSGKQKTVLVNSCSIKESFLLPLRFDYYEDIQTEMLAYRKAVGTNEFKIDYLASMNYKMVEVSGTYVAVKHDPFERTYYTPAIEEIYVSFEFEMKNSSDPVNFDWEPCIISTTDDVLMSGVLHDFDFNHLRYELEENNIRVKHLNKEDLEDIDFECSTKNGMIYCAKKINAKDYIYIDYNPKTHLCKIHDIDDQLFLGTIKNKSQLKQILSWIKLPT